MSASNGIALIADDDEFFRVALRSLLLRDFHFTEVVEVGSLDEAIERLGGGVSFDLALFDLCMPGMESPTNLRAVRECFPSLTVAIVSASSNRRDVLLALEAGVHGYIPKETGVSGLTAALKAVLNGAVFVPASVASFDVRHAAGAEQPTPQSVADSTFALTARQSDVLKLLVEGKSNKEIARNLQLAEGTIKIHMAALFRSLGVTSRSAAAVAGAKLLGR
ncbi:MAG: two component transcriptional regulator, LuxR family [Hyphomicrobiales bacterium]|nr:two component transcriptional regulator, LuxR family [Hyphomicrobiales bacterium]